MAAEFFKDLAQVPTDVRTQIEEALRKGDFDPFDFPELKKLKGYDDKYRIRFGKYRVGLSIDKHSRSVIVERVQHRREFYRIFP